MKKSNTRTKKTESKVQCVEVLIPRNLIVNSGNNLHWTLCVYSLENHSVNKSLGIHNSVIFHFMVYDWKRTIKDLLERHQIPYSIIQYFAPESIYSDRVQQESDEVEQESLSLSEAERELISALESLDASANSSRTPEGNVANKVTSREDACYSD